MNDFGNYENKERKNENQNIYYIVKVLIPVDQYQTEYRALYLGENGTTVSSTLNAKQYDDFNYALDDSKMISDKYKRVNEWAPTYVIKKIRPKDEYNDEDTYCEDDQLDK